MYDCLKFSIRVKIKYCCIAKLLVFYFFLLVSVVEETGLSLTLSETPKTDFIASRPNLMSHNVHISYLKGHRSQYILSGKRIL